MDTMILRRASRSTATEAIKWQKAQAEAHERMRWWIERGEPDRAMRDQRTIAGQHAFARQYADDAVQLRTLALDIERGVTVVAGVHR